MPENISNIAKYNIENGTHFWKLSQVNQHKQQKAAEEFEKKHPILASFTKSAQDARDAKIGAVGAGQVRDLYNTGNNALASELNQKYLGANATGILNVPIGSEIATYGLLGGGLRLGAGTATGAAGSWLGGKAGDLADKQFGTNWIGTAGRIGGGFAGFVPGMNAATRVLRTAAGKGITLHMPQNTFMSLRGQAFDNAANNIMKTSVPTVVDENILAGEIDLTPKQPVTSMHPRAILLSRSKPEAEILGIPQAKYKYNPNTGNFDVTRPLKKWMNRAELMVEDYFYSPEEFIRLRNQGLSPKEALNIMRTRRFNIEVRRPSKIAPLSKNIYGDASNINGIPQIRYNSKKHLITSFNDMLAAAGHELGGHGSSLNIGEHAVTIPPWVSSDLMSIYKHNETLRPTLLPIWKAIKQGDINKANSIAKEIGFKGVKQLDKSSLKSLQDYIKYMEDNQEYTARAISTNIGKAYGVENNWNELQLRQMFTKESVDKLLEQVRAISLPIIAGAGIGAAVISNQNNPDINKMEH